MTPSKLYLLLAPLIFAVVISHQFIKCPKYFFMVGNMTTCHPILNCSHLQDLNIVKLIGYGAVKWVFLAIWQDIFISISVLRNKEYVNDFHDGLKIMKMLKPSQYVTQLIGFCQQSNIIATEYHQMNNANNLKYVLGNNNHSVQLSLKLCLNYVKILTFIHNSPIGVRVNCDSDSVGKILSQLLITDQFTLVLNDVDALPEFNPNASITCGNGHLKHSLLIPPELLHYDENGRQGYSDKSDVWKVPDVCNYIFSLANMNYFHYSLFSIHKKCKQDDPSKRPSSKELFQMYKVIFDSV